jgi:hypothetical protein
VRDAGSKHQDVAWSFDDKRHRLNPMRTAALECDICS